MSVKTQDEISALRISGKFTEFVFKELIEKVETVIDEQKNEKHDFISRKIEALLDSDVKMDAFVKKHTGKDIDKNFLEFGFPPNV